MITLQNKTKSVKVLKARYMPTLRIVPGFNYVDISKKDFEEYFNSEVNKAVIKEYIKFVNIELSDEDKEEAQNALELNKKLNKARVIIDKQNKMILEKDKNNNGQEDKIKEQGDLIKQLIKEVEKLKKKEDKKDKE